MTTIGLLGFSNKEIIVLSLLRTIAQVERSILVTNNPMYLKYSEDLTALFDVGGLSIVVAEDNVANYIDSSLLDDYDIRMFDCIDNIPLDLNIIYVLDSEEIYKELLSDYDISRTKVVYPKSPKNRDSPIIDISTIDYRKFVKTIIDTREVPPCPIASVNKIVSSILKDCLADVPTKEIRKFLKNTKPIYY